MVQMNAKYIIREAKRNIASDRLKDAFHLLSTYLSSYSEFRHYKNELILIEGQHSEYEKLRRINLIDNSFASVTSAKIRRNLLELIEKIIEDIETPPSGATNYLGVIHALFLAIHEDWLESLLKYRSLFKDDKNSPSFPQYVEILKIDSIKAADKRINLGNYIQLLKKRNRYENYIDALSEFISWIKSNGKQVDFAANLQIESTDSLKNYFAALDNELRAGEIPIFKEYFDIKNESFSDLTYDYSNKELFTYPTMSNHFDKLITSLFIKYKAVQLEYQKVIL